MPQLKAACFDLDGTLVDTGPLHSQAELLALKSLGIPVPAPDHPVTFGAGIMAGMRILAEHYGIDSAERVFEAYLPAWQSVFESGLQPMPGADDALRRLHTTGIPMALVTSGESEYVDKVLARFGWHDLFSERVTMESVTDLKPHPEPYLLAARLLGREPGECAGFEDSDSGLRSLRAAGVFSILVGSGHSDRSRLVDADMSISGLDRFGEPEIAALFSG